VLICNICLAHEVTKTIFDGEITKDIHVKVTNTVKYQNNSLFVYVHQVSIFTSTNKNRLQKFKDLMMSLDLEEVNNNDKVKVCQDPKLRKIINKYLGTIKYSTTTKILGEEINTKFTLTECN